VSARFAHPAATRQPDKITVARTLPKFFNIYTTFCTAYWFFSKPVG
jgi:hypothetical protein